MKQILLSVSFLVLLIAFGLCLNMHVKLALISIPIFGALVTVFYYGQLFMKEKIDDGADN